jgi:asparagine synthase (glutamine-hydrolysing)
MVCVRDPLGIRPFYFHLSDNVFVFGSHVHQVLAVAGMVPSPCEEAVANLLVHGALYDPVLTFHEGVQRLEPGTILTVGRKRFAKSRFWDPKLIAKGRQEKGKDAPAELRELLKSSVQDRTRTRYPIGTHLSSGIDSAVVAALAISGWHGEAEDFHTYSWLAEPKNDEESQSNEWAPSLAMAREFGFNLEFTEFGASDLFDMLRREDIGTQDNVRTWYERLILEKARSAGVRTMLSGWGGDQFASSQGNYRFAETFWKGRLVSTHRDMRIESLRSPRPFRRYLGILVREIFAAALPYRLRNKSQFKGLDLLGCCKPGIRKTAQEIRRPSFVPETPTVRGEMLAESVQAHLHNRIDSWAATGLEYGVQYCYPLLDTRIVEFALTTPAENFRANGQGRNLFKLAVKDLLPDEVRLARYNREPMRVLRLWRDSAEAAKLWLKGPGSVQQENEFIDTTKLFTLIEKLPAGEFEPDLQDMLNISTAIASILVLNLGTSFENSRLTGGS